ncbi:2-dehydro-3-deoxyphosphogluconate aldolase [Staphylococcus cohnii]|uniref:2-dehydro-3-deoxyphosphogluconate aldolase n=1 Tax=Staphylococcus TaxID=1279 RepID=UPI0012B1AB20|nr:MULTISPECIES: 2-dehydro-3-deoxyphosphogluconate aldolase [Staphylococcus]MCE5098759.1 2-dehydro-3-deoxyphosphogluconate aldolase [Staphylococcus cohnii]MSU29792.1 2-dehydro-3-deoxyphosphogluconate aldolase [Staphylococcus sp. McC-251-APC-3A2]
MDKLLTLEQLHRNYLIGVVKGCTCEDAILKSEKMIESGIKNIEITFNTPYGELAIKTLTQKFDKSIIVGAGAIQNAVTARVAIINGARYIATPHLDVQIAHICNVYQIPYLPRCGSKDEIIQAMQYEVEVIKLYPANILGVNFMENIYGSIPNINIIPYGGVSLENIDQWYKNGAFAIGIGNALTKGAQKNQLDTIINQTHAFVEKLNSMRLH